MTQVYYPKVSVGIYNTNLVIGIANQPDLSILYWKFDGDIFFPSFSHEISGDGIPLARHGNMMLLSCITINSVCCSSINGGTVI